MAMMAHAQNVDAEGLRAVEGAIVLHVGQQMEGGGDAAVIPALEVALSREGIGALPLPRLDPRTDTLARFDADWSNLFCLAAWPRAGDFEAVENRDDAVPRPFFHRFEGYSETVASPPECPDDVAIGTFLSAEDDVATLTFLPPAVAWAEDDNPALWNQISAELDHAFRRIAPRNGSPYEVNVLVCPRVLQVRTPVAANETLSAQSAILAGRIETAVAGVTNGLDNSNLELANPPVQGKTTVTFRRGNTDLKDAVDPDYNVIDVYVERLPSALVQTSDEAEPEGGATDGSPDTGQAAEQPASEDGTLPDPQEQVEGTNPTPTVATADTEEQGEQGQGDQTAPVAAVPDPASCLTRGSDTLPAALHAEFRPNQSVRVIWPDAGTWAIAPLPASEALVTAISGLKGNPRPAAPDAEDGDETPGTDAQAAGIGDVQPTEIDGEAAVDVDRPAVTYQTWYMVEAYQDTQSSGAADLVPNRAAALASQLGSRKDVVLVTAGGSTDLFTAGDPTGAFLLRGQTITVAKPGALAEAEASRNRTAIVTAIQVPVLPDDAPLEWRPPPVANSMEIARAFAGARQSSCFKNDTLEEDIELLDSFLSYFLSSDYQRFLAIEEHRQSVVLLCRGHGSKEKIGATELAPYLLRAMNKVDEALFPEAPDDGAKPIRATLLHAAGSRGGARYYMFGNSILTHFQLGTVAGTLQSGGEGDATNATPLCKAHPGLEVRDSRDGRDICARGADGTFEVGADTEIDRALFNLTLPTEMQDYLGCTFGTKVVTTQAATETTPAVTETRLRETPAGCGSALKLHDPNVLLDDLRTRPYVFRAAIDVAFEYNGR
ncbi:MAG: hypothetical protein AAF968_08310 [Pseudomonadota bacterium]